MLGDPWTPPPLTHLQDECLAVKGDLDGVHGVPVFLWQGGGNGHGGRGWLTSGGGTQQAAQDGNPKVSGDI